MKCCGASSVILIQAIQKKNYASPISAFTFSHVRKSTYKGEISGKQHCTTSAEQSQVSKNGQNEKNVLLELFDFDVCHLRDLHFVHRSES